MKQIIRIFSALLVLATACQKPYELNTDFTMPTALTCPASVVLDVTSPATVELSWQGGGAADGGIVLYEVLFDREGGNFSDPVTVLPSDLGARSTLTLSHAELNAIARKAGVKPNETGTFIWTVRGSKGGVSQTYNGYQSLIVTRGEGIDNMPERLYVAGSAALEAGQEFRVVSEGLYAIVTRLGAGSLYFTSEKDGGNAYHASAEAKLIEGAGAYQLETAPATGLGRITVDFNTLSLKIESISTEIRAEWEATHAAFAVLEYEGNGTFAGEGEAVFYGPGRDGTPDWCSWVEERYSFLLEVDGAVKQWGANTGGNAWTPDGTEEFYYIVEAEKADWNNLWKMDHALDLSRVRVTIWTNKNNAFTHFVEKAGDIIYEQPTSAPAELFLTGSGAEADGQAFRKASDGVFEIYAKLNAGTISFRDGNGVKYFADSEKSLFIGGRNYEVSASEGVTRLTVDFNTNKISFAEIGTDVRLIWGATFDNIAVLSYQGQGKWAGEGHVVFIDPSRPETNPPSWLGWTEERYYFIAKVNGEDRCWGRLDGESAERPDGEVTETFYDIGEFAWEQWEHLWKMASALDNSDVSVTVNTNDNGHFRHSFTKLTADPFPPTVAPATLALSGSGAEVEGQAFRKLSDGVFQIYARLKEGKISFKGDGKTYFYDAEQGLLQGEGEGDSVATAEGEVTRLTVSFQNLSVKAETINKVRMIWGCNFVDVIPLAYEGAGVWGGSGTAWFIQPGDPRYGVATWLSWVEERYYFVVTIDGEERLCWGRLDGEDAENRPDGEVSPTFYNCGEFSWSQWDHLWKMGSAFDGANIAVKLYSNQDGVMTHTIEKQ